MAADIARTATDDALDALTALDAAARELGNWRAHLLRVVADPAAAGSAQQARSCAGRVAGVVDDAMAHSRDAARRAGQSAGDPFDVLLTR